jgi:PAS domain S-box-containing protein
MCDEDAMPGGEENFRSLADALPQLVWTATDDGNVNYYNSRAKRYSGLIQSSEGVWEWQPVVYPEDLDATISAWREALHTGEAYECEHRVQMADGTYRWHLSRAYRTTGPSGRMWFGTATDIHELKQAQEQLLRNSDTFSVLIQNNPFGVYVVDADFRLQQVSLGAQKVFSNVQPLIGRDFAEVLRAIWPARFADEAIDRFRAALHSGEPFQSPTTVERRSDVDRIESYDWRIERIVMPDGRFGVVCYFYDLSDRQRWEEELRQLAARLAEADRRKDEFLATLAHELRNPLAPIRTGLEVLKMAGDDLTTREEIRTMMERQTEQLVTLVNDLLDVSRITSGKFQLRKRRAALNEIVRSAVEAARPFIEEARHELEIRLPREPIYLEVDPHRLAQVLSNLLNNAARYTPSGGVIELAARRELDDVVVSVKDTGIGIAPEKRTIIFEMFSQADHLDERAKAGLGIGLTLVKSLVEMHGGTVDVRSDGLGHGSEFRIRLPCLQESLAGHHFHGPSSVKPSSNRRVLIVDDSRASADMLTLMVRMLGHEVRTAYDGLEAVKMAADFVPDTIIMDIGMPRMNGLEAARAIRDQNQAWNRDDVSGSSQQHSLTLIALTGWGQEDDKQRTREAGFDFHLVKPPQPNELRALLTRCEQADSC